MRRSVHPAAALTLLFVFFCGGIAAQAQMAAFRDLTQGSRVPGERLSIPATCDKPGSTIADLPSRDSNDGGAKAKLELTIVQVSPAKLEIGNDFTASVRLKNVGDAPILVPATADGEQLRAASNPDTEERYEVGDVSFRLLSGKAKIAVYLDSSGALFANPDDKASYLELAPGKWLDLKTHARVECGLENCVAQIQPDNKAVLTAWWYQRVLVHRVTGCAETHGSVKVRELDSAPFSVVVKNPSAKTAPAKRNFSSLAWR
jgi:hypothetical protein